MSSPKKQFKKKKETLFFGTDHEICDLLLKSKDEDCLILKIIQVYFFTTAGFFRGLDILKKCFSFSLFH